MAVTYIVEIKDYGYLAMDSTNRYFGVHFTKETKEAEIFYSQDYARQFMNSHRRELLEASGGEEIEWEVICNQELTRTTERYVVWTDKLGYLGRVYISAKAFSKYDFTTDVWLAASFKTKEEAKKWIADRKDILDGLSGGRESKIEKVTETINLTVETEGN